MDRIEQRIRSLMAFMATAALLAIPANLAAQGATEAEEQQQQEQAQPETGETSAPAPRAVPQVTGTIASWNGYRIDLKTPDGKTQQVAVNEDTERMVEIKPGAEVTIEYRRKIGDFVIAERVRPVEEAGAAPQPGPDTAPSKMTGTVVSWTPAALVLRTAEGDVTLFLSPRTESLVESAEPGLPVTVEYEETSDGARLAVRVQPAEKESDSE